MAQHAINLIANTGGNGVMVCNVVKKRDLPQFLYTIWGEGTYGGGVLSWYASRNNGVSVVPLTDLTDTAITMTTNKLFNGALNTGSHNNDHISIWVQLSGATSPNLNAYVYDNN